MPLVTSGVENGNLRELVLRRMHELDLPCRDVRTREVGIKQIHQRVRPDQVPPSLKPLLLSSLFAFRPGSN